jgi:signal transduction histidine kinase
LKTLRILIADDHEIVRSGLRVLLTSRAGWELCGEAVDGLDACQKARELQPDVVILDVSMPRLNGLEVARTIRQEQPRLPIVILSQHDPADMRPRALEAGADCYVSKQDVARDLLASIEELVRSRERREAAAISETAATDSAPGARQFRKAELEGISGGHEMGERVRDFDWAQTPAGPIEQWPVSLKTAVRIILNSRYPMFVWWGRDLINFYNDAYIPMLGKRHPGALGRPAAEVWADVWPIVGPQTDLVLNKGLSTWNEELLLVMERKGFTEEAYFTFSYSPAPDDTGRVGGVFCAVTEDTQRVLGRRRLRVLRSLAEQANQARTAEDACKVAADILAQNLNDVPFALLYLLDPQEQRATLAGATGLDTSAGAIAPTVDLASSAGPWMFDRVMHSLESATVQNLPSELGIFPGGIRPERAIVLPMSKPGQNTLAGFVVAGISPMLEFNDDYKGFMNLLAGHIATAVGNARAYEQEKKRAQALAELDRAKTAFFSNVSHEFRTPLTLMLGPLEDALAHDDGSLPYDIRRQLTVAHRNSLRLLKLVNSLLDFSRIEAGRVQAIYQPSELSSFTAELASVFRSAIERSGLRLQVECEAISEPVYVDRDMWEKIVLNLLSNALKFTFEGEIRVGLKAVGRNVELTVKDTGTGIPEAELPRVFERFHRVEGARGRTFEGTGIGLALVQELAALHGGSVRVRSEYGKGSAFTVSVPLGKTHLPPDRIEAQLTLASTSVRAEGYVEEALRWLPDQETPASSPASVLTPYAGDLEPKGTLQIGEERQLIVLADDNADMREYLRRLLGERYRVQAVANGAEAMAAIAELEPDLVLTDVIMPVLDGFGVLRKVRENPATRGTPVILLSARAGEESRVEGLQAGADDYLVKPFTARELMARVGAHLTMARIRREAAERERDLRRALERAHSDLETRVLERTLELQRAEGDLRALSGRLLQTQDEERRRIARELHDSSGQMVTALGINLAVLQREINRENSKAEKAINECLDLVRDMSKELRTISHLLHPPLLDESGLGSALRWYVGGYSERSKIPVELEISPDLGRLPSELETAIFRVVQECLTNIHRHSSSPTAVIKLTRKAHEVELEVRDQGKGMPPELDGMPRDGARPGVGIRGMRERIKQLRGTIEIKSGDGKGTTVIATVPIATAVPDGIQAAAAIN